MAWKSPVIVKLLVGAICICFITAMYLGISSNLGSAAGRRKDFDSDRTLDLEPPLESRSLPQRHVKFSERYPKHASKHHLTVIVPFRDRFEELLVFVPYINEYLEEKGIPHDIIVVNQVDKYRFNRAALINVGFTFATSEQGPYACDYIAMHDVDLLPLNQDLPYDYPGEGNVMHIAGPGLHPKYNYPTFIGGILLVSVEDYKKVDGMSNIYWGWGMEDDEFFVRLKNNDIVVMRPSGLTSGMKNTFRHIHSAKTRPRDMAKCFDQFNKLKKRDRLTGLHNLNYSIASSSKLTIDETPVLVLNVELECDNAISPWCLCDLKNNTVKQSEKKGRGNNSNGLKKVKSVRKK